MTVAFSGGARGVWAVETVTTLCGDPLAAVARVSVEVGAAPPDAAWTLRGVVSNVRYTTAEEAGRLRARQDPLGRAASICAALIPIRKSAAWWALAQDQRRHIYEEQSRHTTVGLEYLPRIARRLHHSRDLSEPFDFLTWFEFAPEDTPAFDELLARMRASQEWRYVDREIDIRLTRNPSA
jgi:chlorite dismutase